MPKEKQPTSGRKSPRNRVMGETDRISSDDVTDDRPGSDDSDDPRPTDPEDDDGRPHS
jgi:hypothetical protein